MDEPRKQDDDSDERESGVPARIIDAEQLFGAEREICIEHGGVRYRLRITRRNKLILQK